MCYDMVIDTKSVVCNMVVFCCGLSAGNPCLKRTTKRHGPWRHSSGSDRDHLSSGSDRDHNSSGSDRDHTMKHEIEIEC
jgi:hypothetical protein